MKRLNAVRKACKEVHAFVAKKCQQDGLRDKGVDGEETGKVSAAGELHCQPPTDGAAMAHRPKTGGKHAYVTQGDKDRCRIGPLRVVAGRLRRLGQFEQRRGNGYAPYFVLHSGSGNNISLVLNLQVNWKNLGGSAGSGGYFESLALDAHVDDASGNRLASLVKPEQTYILFGTANVPPTTDNIGLSYPQGTAASYHVTFGGGTTTMTDPGGMTCTIANGSGTVNDAYQGNPSKYPTVTVTCN